MRGRNGDRRDTVDNGHRSDAPHSHNQRSRFQSLANLQIMASLGRHERGKNQTEAAERRINERSIRRSTVAVAIFTGLLAVVAIVSAIFSALQWLSIKGQLEEMKAGAADTHSLAAAVDQVAAMKNAGIQTDKIIDDNNQLVESQKGSVDLSFQIERGRVSVTNVVFSSEDPSNMPEVTYRLTNIGRTPASLILSRIYLRKFRNNAAESSPILPDFDYPFGAHIFEGIILNGGVSTPLYHASGSSPDANTKAGQFDKWAFRGEVAYRDIFGSEYRNGFCFYSNGTQCREPGNSLGRGNGRYNYEKKEELGTERINWPQ